MYTFAIYKPFVFSGNIGIGTTSPNDILEAVGNVRVSGSLNASSINTTKGAYFATSSGNVGIGTTTPDQELHVIGNVTINDSVTQGAIQIDSTTIAAEIPVYLTNDDIKYFQKRNFILNVKNHPSEMGGMISSASLSGGF